MVSNRFLRQTSFLIALSPGPHYPWGRRKSPIAGIFSLAVAQAQTVHFPDLEWREKERDHIMIRTHRTGSDSARRYAEKTYEVMEEILPELTADFETGNFRTPGGGEAGTKGAFRFTTYLVDIKKGAALALGTDWTRTLRDLYKKGERESLEKTLAAEILSLSPNQSGYLFALSYFLVSDEEKAGKYQAFLAAIREGATPDRDLLLKTYGFPHDAAFKTAWYDWMESRDFR